MTLSNSNCSIFVNWGMRKRPRVRDPPLMNKTEIKLLEVFEALGGNRDIEQNTSEGDE